MYQAERSQSYMEALALINADKIQGNPYPEELQPIENEANVIASLLLVPDKCLKFDILHSTFNEIQDKYGFQANAIVSMQEVIEYLYQKPYKGKILIDDTLKAAIDAYYKQYGAK